MNWKIIPEGARFRMECGNIQIAHNLAGRWSVYDVKKQDCLHYGLDLETAICKANEVLLNWK